MKLVVIAWSALARALRRLPLGIRVEVGPWQCAVDAYAPVIPCEGALLIGREVLRYAPANFERLLVTEAAAAPRAAVVAGASDRVLGNKLRRSWRNAPEAQHPHRPDGEPEQAAASQSRWRRG